MSINPCNKDSKGNRFADFVFIIYRLLNFAADDCPCCSFFRGAFFGSLLSVIATIIFYRMMQ